MTDLLFGNPYDDETGYDKSKQAGDQPLPVAMSDKVESREGNTCPQEEAAGYQ